MPLSFESFAQLHKQQFCHSREQAVSQLTNGGNECRLGHLTRRYLFRRVGSRGLQFL